MNIPKPQLGPGALVAAAFVGPGTVTVCTLAGVQFGYALIWALLLSIFACIYLQEMALRIGLATGKGLSEILRQELTHPVARTFIVITMLGAIVIGNAAYEAGNISGGVLGLELIIGHNSIQLFDHTFNLVSIGLGLAAFALLWMGNYKLLERALICLVLLMSLTFLVVAILSKPDIGQIASGMIPSFPASESAFFVIGLVGTTVVPYNLFLHAALVNERWSGINDLSTARRDLVIAVVLGGVLSLSILITGATVSLTDLSGNNSITGATGLALGLEPMLGSYAKYLIAIGLFAAGLTSAITAPLAASYVARGCLGWNAGLKDKRFRAVWLLILLMGVFFSSIGSKPIQIIQFAQFANGLLLPITAGLLLWLMNRKSLLGEYTNTPLQNLIGVVILLLVLSFAIRSLDAVFGLFS